MMYHPQTHIPLQSILGVLQIVIKSQGYREPDTVISDSENSTVTYTEVSSPFEDLSDIGSPGVAPPSPDYVPGPEELEQAPPLPDFVLEPVYPEFIPLEDEVLPAEEQPLPAAASPTADSLGYVPESDPKEDQEEDDDEDPEEDPTNRGDNGDDEDELSNDDEDDNVDIEGDEEEHPAPADSIAVALPVVDHASSAEETEPFETDESAATPPPHPAYRVTTRMSIRDEPPTTYWSEAEIARLFAIPSPPPSPLSLWSSPLPQIPSPSLPVSPLLLPASPTYPLGYRAAMIRQRAEAPSTSHPPPLPSPIAPSFGTPPLLPIPLPTPSPPLLPPSTNRYKVGESLSSPTGRPDGDFRRDYGFIATLNDEIMRDPERDIGRSTVVRDRGVVGSRPQETNTVDKSPEINEDTTNIVDSTSESTGTR
ncbi:hypothetical protein Tco_1285724 [Tanacetum coccineum]